ncbi:hypothetical protein [Salinigranum sp. GCM10025319]|uniref:hypothetical protein n=1 Tax=Salinigranum sp. GCM10025319 TaxID=3252687 RepID=UPI003609AAE0
MQPNARSELFEFTTEDALDQFDHSRLSSIQLIAEYNESVYSDLYVQDTVVETLGGVDAYERQRDLVADFLRLDLLERNAYCDLVPRAGQVELLVTQAADLMFIRAFRADDALFISVERNGSIDEFVDIVEALVDDE